MNEDYAVLSKAITESVWDVSDYEFSDDICGIADILLRRFPQNLESLALEFARGCYAANQTTNLIKVLSVLYLVAPKQDRIEIETGEFLSMLALYTSLPAPVRLHAASILAVGCRRYGHDERSAMAGLAASAISALEALQDESPCPHMRVSRCLSRARKLPSMYLKYDSTISADDSIMLRNVGDLVREEILHGKLKAAGYGSEHIEYVRFCTARSVYHFHPSLAVRPSLFSRERVFTSFVICWSPIMFDLSMNATWKYSAVSRTATLQTLSIRPESLRIETC